MLHIVNFYQEHNEMFLAYDYVKDEPLTYEEAKAIPEDDPRQLNIIYGSIDDLVKVGTEWIICDKKTTGSIDYFSKVSFILLRIVDYVTSRICHNSI